MLIKNRQTFLAILAGAAALVFIGDRLILSPLCASWKEREARIAELAKSVSQGQQMLDRRKTISDRWSDMRGRTLPDSTSLAENELFKSFDRWSQASGISILSIKPQWKQTDEDYTLLECRADATGDMQTLSRFLYEVEKRSMALRVEAVEITSHDNNGQNLSVGLQLSGLLLTTKEK